MPSKTLIIVESPGKIKTLSKFLGKDCHVEASKGHLIDLPESRFGINIERGFAPEYQVVPERGEVIRNLLEKAKQADRIYLAPDPDREGEAISWHLASILGIDPLSPCRITFNAITKSEVLQALKNPRPIDLNLVNAQQSRRILDRLVGYRLSPLLWKKVFMGLSAGRVQSVAVMLICDREKEILNFKPTEYWTIKTILQTDSKAQIEAKLVKTDGRKTFIPDNETAEIYRKELENNKVIVQTITGKEKRQSPPPPFITSTLQQEAYQRFGFTAKRTMSIAQRLYEGVELEDEGHVGLITYMRTDSFRISPEGLAEAAQFVATRFGPSYELSSPRIFRSKKEAQDAHEAIRPTSVWRTPEKLSKSLKQEELKLYSLIWKRFLATQMADAVYEVVTIDFTVGRHQLQAVNTIMKFDGFTAIYTESNEESTNTNESENNDDNSILTALKVTKTPPKLTEGQTLQLWKVECKQHFTQPPPRYNESMLIRTLEKEGIGRPSTYATIVETIQQRGYVKKVEGKFVPSEAAFLTTNILTSCFKDLINIKFTANMENLLDEIEDGKIDWMNVLNNFYGPFMEDLKAAESKLKKAEISTDCFCEKCGKPMVVKLGRTGKFLACSGYPECKNTENIPDDILLFFSTESSEPLALREKLNQIKVEESAVHEVTDKKCPVCNAPMVIKTGRFGKFYSCSKYPECKTTQPFLQEIGIPCPMPNCNGSIILKRSKRGRIFYGCSNYPSCQIVTWSPPTGQLCSQCGSPLIRHSTKKSGEFIKCSNKACNVKIPDSGGNSAKEN